MSNSQIITALLKKSSNFRQNDHDYFKSVCRLCIHLKKMRS